MSKMHRRQLIKLGIGSAVGLPLLAAGTQRAMAATHQVEIKGFKYIPASLQVAAGDTVVFTNVDRAPHTATAVDGSFDTGRLNRGKSGEITVAAAGTFRYICTFHPNMKGQITAT